MNDALNRRSRQLNRGTCAVPRAFRNARRLLALFSTAVLLSLAGCGSFGRSPSNNSEGGFFGWHVYAPFDTSEVKTVAVFFKTNSFRRDIEKQLTEAVQKEINMRTPFKLEPDHTKADSLLTGTITYTNKGLVVEAPTNFARELSMSVNVAVKWTRNPPTELEDKQLPTMVVEMINFVPEVGDTTLGATNHVVQALAKQIVDMMEQPWFNENDLQ
jgi:hypothetical protein